MDDSYIHYPDSSMNYLSYWFVDYLWAMAIVLRAHQKKKMIRLNVDFWFNFTLYDLSLLILCNLGPLLPSSPLITQPTVADWTCPDINL